MTALLAPPTVDDGSRREFLAGGTGLLLAGLLGCGDDDGGPASPDTAERSIESKFGTQRISEVGRVVTLDDLCTDDTLALGVTPVGIAGGTSVPGQLQSWTRDALGNRRPARLDSAEQIPYEQVAELNPDLILAVHNYPLEERKVYKLLSDIAPTVHYVDSPTNDPWQQTLRRIGTALGRRGRADDLVAEAEAGIAEVRERGVLAGKTVTLFNADPGGLYAITDPKTQAIRFLAELGMQLSPRVEQVNEIQGRGGVSPERYDLLDADLVIGTAADARALDELEDDRLFQQVPAVKAGRFIRLPFEEIVSIVFPSLLGVQYATAEVVPMLERALEA